MRTKKLSVKDLVTLIGSALALLVGVTVVHEAGHILAAVTYGVPFTEVNFIMVGINPGVRFPDWFSGVPHPFVPYAGGTTAALLLTAGYFLICRRYYLRQPASGTWLVGLMVMAFATEQVANAWLEGSYPGLYFSLTGINAQISDAVLATSCLPGILLHLALCPLRLLRLQTAVSYG